MDTLPVPKAAEHSWLAVALGFLFASARCSLLEAQYLWRDKKAQWRGCPPGYPSPPQGHPTHPGHRVGTAGRRGDGSSAHCRNFQGTWHKLYPGRGHIQLRHECLECEWGSWSVRGPGFHLTFAAGCVTLGLSSRCLHRRDGQCLSLSLCQLCFPGDGVCLLPEAARWAGVPCNTPPGPRLPLAIASHLGGSGSSRPGAWVRSTPFPGPGRFGSPCSMGAPPGGDGRGEELFRG